MKILTAQQTREADAYTIKNEPIKSIDLMERASQKCVDWLINEYDVSTSFTVFCGVGNNGGDGLVIARMLQQKGYQLSLYIVHFSAPHTVDFSINLDKTKFLGIDPVLLTEESSQFEISPNSVVIDAIFGSGLTRPIDGFIAGIVHHINECEATVVAIDMPSGLFSESNYISRIKNIVQADYTLTFQQPKLTMFFPENFKYVGEFVVLDIGLHENFLNEVETTNYYITSDYIKSILHHRNKFSHKGTFGHALLIAGSEGKMGAEVLSAKACLRTGVGLLTVQIPKKGLNIMQTVIPEVMCITDESDDCISTSIEISSYTSIGIGPGLGQAIPTQHVLKLLIQNSNKPLVIDADALNILSENHTWLAFLPAESILTPHPKEFERLFGKWRSDEERLEKQKQESIKNNVIIVLKGANTSISLPDGAVYFNSTGNPGMATAGSGDVLTGIITSLLAQGYTAKEAAVLGVYLHGLSGDLARDKVGINSLMASDIIDSIQLAYKYLGV